jgi:hypothetical protein
VHPPRHTQSNQSGQALPEFALVLPLLLVLLLGMLDLGKAFHYWIDTTQITSEGARYAAVNRKPDPASGLSLQQQLQGQGTSGELRTGSSDSLPTPAEVCIDFPLGTSNPGDPVRVTMRFIYHWLPFLANPERMGIASTSVESSAIMRLEATPTNFTAGCA